MTLALGEVGDALRAAGLTARALAAWAGTDRVSALPAWLGLLAERTGTRAAATLAVFVGGAAMRADALGLGDAVVDALVAHGLAERAGEALRARVAIVPLGPSLMVCDREDAPDEPEVVCWPDDSSHHLVGALPERRVARWLDLACGSAFAPLARPGLAAEILGADLNARAVAYARLGAGLSGVAHVAARAGDVGAAHAARFDLVTCNAPIPDGHPILWRGTDARFFARLWAAAEAALAPGGLAVVHGTEDELLDFSARARGERLVLVYTPELELGFGVAWWRPDAPARRVVARRELTDERPHVDARDRAELLA